MKIEDPYRMKIRGVQGLSVFERQKVKKIDWSICLKKVRLPCCLSK